MLIEESLGISKGQKKKRRKKRRRMRKKRTEEAGTATEWNKGNGQCGVSPGELQVSSPHCGLSPEFILGGQEKTQTTSSS